MQCDVQGVGPIICERPRPPPDYPLFDHLQYQGAEQYDEDGRGSRLAHDARLERAVLPLAQLHSHLHREQY